MLQDPSGPQLTTLPKPASDDERAVASAWNSRRRKAKPLIADQSARLEKAMIEQRRWAPGDFQSRIAAHPLLGRLARRLVRVLDDRTVRQPLAQAEREVFAGEDLSAWWQRTVGAAALYRLVRHGWRDQLFRPFGAEGRVVLRALG